MRLAAGPRQYLSSAGYLYLCSAFSNVSVVERVGGSWRCLGSTEHETVTGSEFRREDMLRQTLGE